MLQWSARPLNWLSSTLDVPTWETLNHPDRSLLSGVARPTQREQCKFDTMESGPAAV